MDLPDWLASTHWIMVPVSAVGIYLAVILFHRLNGLRSFSTMSAFDFVMTVAIGSLVATTILNPRPSLLEGVLGLGSLFLLQWLVASGRAAGKAFERVVDNEPLLLMRKGEVIEKNLEKARVTRDDLRVKLRESGILRYRDVEAVIMETTGTISVIRRQEGVELDEDLLQSVRD